MTLILYNYTHYPHTRVQVMFIFNKVTQSVSQGYA